jgi:hypothetical protein
MPTHSSQIGLVLQNGFVFLGGTFHRWVYVPNNFTKLFGFFRKMKNFCFLINATKWFYKIFLGLGQRLGMIGVAFTKWLWYFSKNNEYIYKIGL